MFDKRPKDWKAEDVWMVCIDHHPESDQLEFKRMVPGKKAKPDPWAEGEDRIGEHGRNELLAEIIAFANAHGGWLLIGIDETKSKPPRANTILPVRNCAELAERLQHQARDCIDPQIPVLEIEGVPSEKDGSGVVVCHVPRSRAAPHRLAPNRECYIRRGTRTEAMRSMREIQDLTLNTVRGLDDVKAMLAARRDAYGHLFGEATEGGLVKLGIRVSLVPTTPLFIERVHNVPEVRPPAIVTRARYEGHDRYFDAAAPLHIGQWRPFLRGSRAVMSSEHSSGAIEIRCDGTIDYHFVRLGHSRGRGLYLTWLVGWVTNALCAAAKFRQAASAPGAEYALEVEVAVAGDAPQIIPFGGREEDADGRFPLGRQIFPDYSVKSLEEFGATVAWVERDFWNAAGIEDRANLCVDFERAFRDAGVGAGVDA